MQDEEKKLHSDTDERDEEFEELERSKVAFKYVGYALMYLLLMLFCFANFRTMYLFGLIFLALVLANGYFAYKHWNDKVNPNVKKIKNKINAYTGKRKMKKRSKKSNYRQQYQNRLREIDAEFDFDYGDEEDE